MSNAVILMSGLLNCNEIPTIEKQLHDFKFKHDDFKVVIHTWDHEYNDSHTFVNWFKANFPKNKIYIQKEKYDKFDMMVNKFASSEFINYINSITGSATESTDMMRRHTAIYYSMAQSYMFAKTVVNITDDTLLFRIKPNTAFFYNKIDLENFFEKHIELGYRTAAPNKNDTVFISLDLIIGDYPSVIVNENAFCAHASVWQKVFGDNTENFLKHTIQEIYIKHFDQCMMQYIKNKGERFPFPVGSIVWSDIFLYHKLCIKPYIMAAAGKQDKSQKKHIFY
jgi:hypothetical protein